MSLSDKRKHVGYDKIDLHRKVYPEEKVKEFIKEILQINYYIVSAIERDRRIKKLAGDKLI